jgi:hypothetical protein
VRAHNQQNRIEFSGLRRDLINRAALHQVPANPVFGKVNLQSIQLTLQMLWQLGIGIGTADTGHVDRHHVTGKPDMNDIQNGVASLRFLDGDPQSLFTGRREIDRTQNGWFAHLMNL